MIELSRVGRESVLGYNWRVRFRCTVLGPWNFVGVPLTNEASALTVVAFTLISIDPTDVIR